MRPSSCGRLRAGQLVDGKALPTVAVKPRRGRAGSPARAARRHWRAGHWCRRRSRPRGTPGSARSPRGDRQQHVGTGLVDAQARDRRPHPAHLPPQPRPQRLDVVRHRRVDVRRRDVHEIQRPERTLHVPTLPHAPDAALSRDRVTSSKAVARAAGRIGGVVGLLILLALHLAAAVPGIAAAQDGQRRTQSPDRCCAGRACVPRKGGSRGTCRSRRPRPR